MHLNKKTDCNRSVFTENNLHCFLLTIAFLSLFFSQTFAKPAYPWPMERTQPDGSRITVLLRGNENFHYTMSADGYLLLLDSTGVLYYANENAAMSACKAHNVNERTSEETKFLSSFNKDSVIVKHHRDAMAKKKPSHKPAPTNGSLSSTGSPKGLVVLVQFLDSTFKVHDPRTEYTNYMNKTGYSNYCNQGSCRDYYIDNSDSAFMPTFYVYGPVTLSKGEASYVSDGGATAMTEGCKLVKSQYGDDINFSDYDNDNDGKVDFVFVFFAGMGASDGGDKNSTIWPCQWNADAFTLDGVTISHYAISNEANGASGQKGNFKLDGIASFCHEFGHVLGLPDIYSVSGTASNTPGGWDEMDVGCYNTGSNTSCGNTSTCPPNFTAEERYTLGWLTPSKLASSASTQVLPSVNNNKAFKLCATSDTTEFFILENRQQSGWDAGIPGHGMLIWHIDYSASIWEANTVNDNSSHQYVDIEEASGSTSSSGAASFPGTANVTKFTKFTTWGKVTLTPSIYNITENNGVIYFTTDSSIKITGINNDIANMSVKNFQIIVKGNKLFINTKISGEKSLRLYGLNGQLLRTEKLAGTQSSVSLDKIGFGLKGMVIARLTSDGKLWAQESIKLP